MIFASVGKYFLLSRDGGFLSEKQTCLLSHYITSGKAGGKYRQEQVCIPVGCVPPAAMADRGVSVLAGDVGSLTWPGVTVLEGGSL